MSPLDLHVLSTPPAFVLSQDQTLMFNPYPQLHAYSRTTRQSRSLSSFRQGVSLFQNLTVVDASSHLPALFVNILLVQNDFLCIVFKDRSLSFASLADSLIIITNTPYVVNPLFATFPSFNFLRRFGSKSGRFTAIFGAKQAEADGFGALRPQHRSSARSLPPASSASECSRPARTARNKSL